MEIGKKKGKKKKKIVKRLFMVVEPNNEKDLGDPEEPFAEALEPDKKSKEDEHD